MSPGSMLKKSFSWCGCAPFGCGGTNEDEAYAKLALLDALHSKVLIKTFGRVDDDVLRAIKAVLRDSWGLEVRFDERLGIPLEAYCQDRGQYRAQALLYELAHSSPPACSQVVKLAVTGADIFADEEEDYAFGLASKHHRAAVISLARLEEQYEEGPPASRALLAERAGKLAVHELGQALGLPYCLGPPVQREGGGVLGSARRNLASRIPSARDSPPAAGEPTCVAAPVCDLAQLDARGTTFCARCRKAAGKAATAQPSCWSS